MITVSNLYPIQNIGFTGPTGSNGATGATGASGDKYTTTSSTALQNTLGLKTLTIQSGLPYVIGQMLILSHNTNVRMIGKLITYTGTTLEVDVVHAEGTFSTYSSWNISIAGEVGPKGNTGNTGSTGAGAPVGVAGPSSGKSQSAHCNPVPNMTLTKWTLGPNNDLCVQVDARIKPMVDQCQVGSIVKSISFRVTPTMYVATRIEK